MDRKRTQFLITYLVSSTPMAEAIVHRGFELRTTGLAGICSRLGMIEATVDERHLALRRHDLHACPQCQKVAA